MRRTKIAMALILVAAPALAQSAAEQSGANSLLGMAPTTEDFVKAASMSDAFEIASSQLALDRGEGATKTFADQMVKDHQKTTAELKQLVESGKVKGTPGAGMSDEQGGIIDNLKELTGPNFAEQYQEIQVEAHEDAVDLFKRYAEGGENPELKSWAAITLPALEHHLMMAKELPK